MHLESIGLPLVIDPIYNRRASGDIRLSQFKRDYRATKGEQERPLMSRLTLHSHQLTFTHPNCSEMTLTSDLPKDFRATVKNLAKYSSR